MAGEITPPIDYSELTAQRDEVAYQENAVLDARLALAGLESASLFSRRDLDVASHREFSRLQALS